MHQRNIYLKSIARSTIRIFICVFAVYELIPILEAYSSAAQLSSLGHNGFGKLIYKYSILQGMVYLFLALACLSALIIFINFLKLAFSFTEKGKQFMAQAEANEAIRVAEENLQSAQRHKEYLKREERLKKDERSSSSNDLFMSPASPLWNHGSSSSSWSGGWSGGSCDSGSSGGGDCGGGGGGGGGD